MTMTPLCTSTQAAFSAYLDGDVNGHEMQQIAGHLESCTTCEAEFASWRAMQDSLAMLRTAKAPEDLGLKLRLAISRERSRTLSSILDTLSLRWDNAFRPMLIQVSAGLAMSVLLLGALGLLFGAVAAPQAVLANDEPLGAMTAPHYLYSADHPRTITTDYDATIVVQAEVNDAGRVYDYTIVSGPQDAEIKTQLTDQLLNSVFEPAHVFGAPVRGWVIVTFTGTSARA